MKLLQKFDTTLFFETQCTCNCLVTVVTVAFTKCREM